MSWKWLHNACWAGDPCEVETLLAEGADPNQIAPTTWRQSPLARTLEFRLTHPKHAGHVEVVRILLAAGADPQMRSTPLDMTPYELALLCGLAPAAQLLPPPQSPHPTGMTPLWLAAASRIPAPFPTNLDGLNTPWRSATPLAMAAAHAANWPLAAHLLKQGANPNIGPTLLHASCQWHLEHLLPALKFLAENGWNVNTQDETGQTALHKAAFLGYNAAIRALLKLGADPAIRDNAHRTPAHCAVKPLTANLLTPTGSE